MLNGRHYHIASFLQAPYRESRLAWFANAQNNQQPEEEERPEVHPGSPEDGVVARIGFNPEENEQSVESITEHIRSNMERVQPLVTDAIIQSPFLLMQLAEKIQDSSVTEDIRQYVEALRNNGDTKQLSKKVEAHLQTGVQDPQTVLNAIHAFENRRRHYRELQHTLGNISLTKLATLELKLKERGQLDLLSDPSLVHDEQKLRKELQDHGIDIDEYIASAPEEVPDTPGVAQTLHNKLATARQLSVMEEMDTGGESTLSSVNEVDTQLTEELLQARTFLRLQLERKAYALHTAYNKKIGPIAAFVHKNPDDVLSQYGVSISAADKALTEAVSPIATTLGAIGDQTEKNLLQADDAQFVQDAESKLQQLSDHEWLIHTSGKALLKKLFGELQSEHIRATEWAAGIATRYANATAALTKSPELVTSIVAAFGGGVSEEEFVEGMKYTAESYTRIQQGKATAEDADNLYHYGYETVRRRQELLLSSIENPNILAHVEQAREVASDPHILNNEKKREEISQQIESVAQQLKDHPALQHEACSVLGINKQLSSAIASLKNQIQSASNVRDPAATNYLQSAKAGAQKLASCTQMLDALHSGNNVHEHKTIESYEQATGYTDTHGFYHLKDGTIHLNVMRISQDNPYEFEKVREQVLHHETGHALIDILSRRSGVLPGIFIGMHAVLQQQIPGSKPPQTYQGILKNYREQWNIPKGLSPQQEMEYLTDELLNKFASWKHKGVKPKSAELQQLYNVLEELHDQNKQPFAFEEVSLEDPRMGLSNTDTEELIDVDALGSGDGEGESESESSDKIQDVGQKLRDIRQKLVVLNNFIEAHPELPAIGAWKEWHTVHSEALASLEDKLNKKIDEENTNKRISELEDVVNKSMEQISAFEGDELNVDQADVTGKVGLKAIMGDITWMNIGDVIQMFKSAGEDLQRIWKRRGERKQSLVGEALSNWIPEEVLYFGQLSAEYHRRGDASENEEVNKWKEALTETDSYAMIGMLSSVRNKDQLKAMIELLTERGRMDWNDVGFWKTLNAMSNYRMPIEACKNSDLLRDKWIQKLVYDIWGDKDHYYNWRRDNDSKYSSGMEDFKDYVDQLSNLSGGLSGELRRQLELWERYTGPGKTMDDIPDEVNPHKYEKIILYSIENGKMSMEDKFFYLIQGVAVGLLSIDRIRVLAGERGGILNLFPFIDYFYGKNNSLPEVKALARRLRESESRGADGKWEPGPKTTLWLHLEMAREEAVRQRVAKATSGLRLEKLDHEDIPMIASQVDYTVIETMAGVISGSRQQLSPEARKNAYVGFSTKFKALARLAQMDNEKLARFTDKDAAEAAKSIAAAVHFDNIITGNASDGKPRPTLSWDQINNEQGPSTGEFRVKDVRDANQDLIKEIVEEANLPWDQIRADKDEFVRGKENQDVYDENHEGEKERLQRNFNGMRRFATALEQRLRSDPEMVKRILIKHADSLIPEHQSEAGQSDESADRLSLEKTKLFFREQRASAAALSQAA